MFRLDYREAQAADDAGDLATTLMTSSPAAQADDVHSSKTMAQSNFQYLRMHYITIESL